MRPTSTTVTESSSEPGERADSGVGRWTFDLRNSELQWSAQTLANFGLAPGDPNVSSDGKISLQRALSTVHPEDLHLVTAQMTRWTRRIDGFEIWPRVVHPDGSVRIIEVRGRRGDGSHRVVGTDRDVTPRPPAAAERWRLAGRHEDLLRALGEGVCCLDGDGRVVYCNPAFAALVRRDESELIDRTLHELVHVGPDGQEEHPAHECPYRCGTRPGTDCDAAVRRGDGTRGAMRYTLSPLDARDASAGCVLAVRDAAAFVEATRLQRRARRALEAVSAQRGALLHALTEAQERERLRIASEIHDDTIQTLGAVALRLDRMRSRAPDPGSSGALVEAAAEVREVAVRLRGVLVDLMPPVAIPDLAAAVRSYCTTLFDDGTVTYSIVGAPEGLGADRSLLAYRFVQEALRNVRRHARASHVRVEFWTGERTLDIHVRDDGVGAGAESVEAPSGHAGVRILCHRVEAAGGAVSFGCGLDGRGTTLRMSVPLDGPGA